MSSFETGAHEPTSRSATGPSISMDNRNSAAGLVPQETPPAPSPAKSIDKIRTYLPWSIFNLLLIPMGIMCCYLSRKIYQLKGKNRYDEAKMWSKRIAVLNLMTTLLMVALVITVAMLRYDYVQRNPPLRANETRTTSPFIPWQPGR